MPVSVSLCHGSRGKRSQLGRQEAAPLPALVPEEELSPSLQLHSSKTL